MISLLKLRVPDAEVIFVKVMLLKMCAQTPLASSARTVLGAVLDPLQH